MMGSMIIIIPLHLLIFTKFHLLLSFQSSFQSHIFIISFYTRLGNNILVLALLGDNNPLVNKISYDGSPVNEIVSPICITIPYNLSIPFVLIQQSLSLSLFDISKNANYNIPAINMRLLHELTNSNRIRNIRYCNT